MKKKKNKSWVLEVQEDEQGEKLIELPEDLLTEAGWKEGDVLVWSDNKDGSWSLNKKGK
jgi:hypothetical protein